MLPVEDTTDYSKSGLTIQYAILDQMKRFPNKENRPKSIVWDGFKIMTGDKIAVPQKGIIRGEFINVIGDIEQGFDLKVNGWFELRGGEKVESLRTWYDAQYEPVVQYPFFSKDGVIWGWNVYKMKYPGGQIVEERWTGNAGFWVEIKNDQRIYHCSHGMAYPPNFESLVFKISITPPFSLVEWTNHCPLHVVVL